jgi:hypothetical protein
MCGEGHAVCADRIQASHDAVETLTDPGLGLCGELRDQFVVELHVVPLIEVARVQSRYLTR